MALQLKGARALVTGASSGIGMEIARELAARGCSLVIAARRAENLNRLAEEIKRQGARIAAVAADLCDPAQVDSMAARAAL